MHNESLALNETPQRAAAPGEARPHAISRWLRRVAASPTFADPWQIVVLFAVGIFLLLYGLVPLFGGDRLGLVGADEPRYAQIAREMLNVHDQACDALHAELLPRSYHLTDVQKSYQCLMAGTVTPILYGLPWLEKPALYYWRAMSFFREFGVSDWSARLPSTSGSAFLILMIFLHMRRFRPGGHLDAALITLSTIAMLGFSRGASTDMQLAAPFSIGMLGWYAWYETGKKFWLFDLYFFRRSRYACQGACRPVSGARYHFALRGAAPGVDLAAPNDLAPWHHPLSSDGTALVYRGAAAESDLRQGVLF